MRKAFSRLHNESVKTKITSADEKRETTAWRITVQTNHAFAPDYIKAKAIEQLERHGLEVDAVTVETKRMGARLHRFIFEVETRIRGRIYPLELDARERELREDDLAWLAHE